MCNHVYISDYALLPSAIGKRCPYPEFYRSTAATQSASPAAEVIDLPADRHGTCIFHSREVEWKRANDLPARFRQLVELLNEFGSDRFYDFAEFVFVGSPVTTKKGGRENRLRIANATFSKQAYFTGAHFLDPVDIEDVNFADADLDRVIFAHDLSIRSTGFRSVSLERVTFSRVAFVGVEIVNQAFFSHARFTGGTREGYAVHFKDVFFRGLTNFVDAVFELSDESAAVFEGVSFEDVVDFSRARFKCHTVFRETTFSGHAEFINTAFELVGSAARYRGAAAQVSRYKLKKDNWLHVDSSGIPDIAGESAWEISIFSKRLTLRICRIV